MLSLFRLRRKPEPKKFTISGSGQFCVHVFGNALVKDDLEDGDVIYIRDADHNLVAAIGWKEGDARVTVE